MITSELAGNYIKLLKSSLLNALDIENEARILHTFINRLNGGFVDFNDYFDIAQSKPEMLELLRECSGG